MSTESPSPDAIAIVGAGEAGTTAALTLRSLGFAGTITLFNAESGSPFYRPALSKPDYLAGDEAALQYDAKLSALRDADVDLRQGAVVERIDRGSHSLKLRSSESVRYDRLLLATGAEPRKLEIPGAEAAKYLRSRSDGEAIRARITAAERVLVIGSGLIAFELAASARQSGCAVTVLASGPRLMARSLPDALAKVLIREHVANGVSIRTSVRAGEIEPTASGTIRVVLAGGETLECDVVLAGIGALPNTVLADAAGLKVDDGIVTNAALQTSDPDIFAAGDCCNFPHPLAEGTRLRGENWQVAVSQGEAVAASMLGLGGGGSRGVGSGGGGRGGGSGGAYEAVPWFWTDQYGLGAQVAGHPLAAAQTVVRTRADGVQIHFGLSGGGRDARRLVSASAVGPAGSVGKDIRLAQALIARRAAPDPELLRDPGINLRRILADRESRS